MNGAKSIGLLALLLLSNLLLVSPAQADGIIIPEPPICDPAPCPPLPMAQLAIEYHHVKVVIQDQVAVTHVDQVFRNDNHWPVEGTYIFPLPNDAAVTDFVLWVDGEPAQGKVLERDEARRAYEEVVRNLRDPALLEYLDRGAVQASVFPIPPGGTRRIELEYSQVLPADAGLIHYVYPLNTEKFSTDQLDEVSVSVSVTSPQAIKAVYSPSHSVDIIRQGDYRFTAGYEDYDLLPDRDFELYYSIAQDEIGLNLLTFRDPQEPDADGFFLLLAAPSVEAEAEKIAAKDVLLVLDQSGSMEGEKFRQAQEALRYILNHLNGDDRFNIIAFSTGTRSYALTLRPAEAANEAKRWVDSLSAKGSTDINRALLEAVSQADKERTTIMIFLTDGLPTEGVTDRRTILSNFKSEASASVRLFAFGVGYDVDTLLLDSLAQSHHGTTTYVSPGQALDEAISGFYTKISTPLLTDLELDFGDALVFDLYPEELPDLFAGGQLILAGRYHQPTTTSIRLSGEVDGAIRTFDYAEQYFRSSGGPEFLPRLWATRKIGALLSEIRLKGPDKELVDQIVRLSIRYGIVTEYTSYLVTEPLVFGEEAQSDVVEETYKQILGTPTLVSGQEAVERAAAESAIGAAEAPLTPNIEMIDVVRVVGSRTFRLADGVWTDTTYDPHRMEALRVPFLSEDYFALVEGDSTLAAAFALGERVIAVSRGQAFEVVGSDESGDPISLPSPGEQQPSAAAPDPPSSGPAPSEAREPGGAWLSCPGVLPALGLLLAPLPFRRRIHRAL